MLNKLLDRPVAVTMILLTLITLGAVSIVHLPISLIPDVDVPYITVQVIAPDMSAREIDKSVVTPLRSSLVQINHLSDFNSESMDGTSTITLDFDPGSDMDYLCVEVNEKIDRAMSSLPKIDRPKVFKATSSDIPAFYINVTLREDASEEAFLRMSRFCEGVVAKRIEQLGTVAMVDLSGTAPSQISVIPDERKLQSVGMTLSDFEKCITSANVSLSNLTIRDGEYHYNVKFRSFVSSVEDIADIYFKSSDRILRIRDVASVMQQSIPLTGLDRSDGKRAVIMAVIKQSDARMSDLKKEVESTIRSLEDEYSDLKFTVTRDQTALLEYSIKNLLLNILFAILLDCLIIFLFMRDFRSPLIVSLTIPLSLIVSSVPFYAAGLSINIISLSGLLLGVGMLVDNTIILVDNITGRWGRGEDLRSAVIRGTAEVRGAMLSSVLTTCAVFIPLVFVKGIAGELFRDQAFTITIVLLTSYLVTIFAVPVYYWQIYRKMDSFKVSPLLEKLRLRSAESFYERVMSWMLGHRWFAWVLTALCAALLVLCVAKMPREKLPPVTYTDTLFNISWNEHITLEENGRRVASLCEAVSPLCSQQTSMEGVQQFVLSHSGNQAMNEACLYFKCENADDLSALKETLSEKMRGEWPSAVSGFSVSGNVFDMVFAEKQSPLIAHLRPSNGAALGMENLSEILSGIADAIPDIPLDEIRSKTDVLYVSDPELMALYGASFHSLVSAIENSLSGNRIFEIVQGDRTVPVVMGSDALEMDEILSETLVNCENADESGQETVIQIPASYLCKQTFERDLKSIVSGEEGNYYPLSVDIPSGRAQEVMRKIKGAVRENGKWDVTFSGSVFSNQEMLRSMSFILLIAVTLLFLILAAQFESLVQPLIILSEVVIDIGVSLAGLYIAGVSINLMSLIGLVVICGIVINDSILKIDTINNLRSQGLEMDDAIHTAGRRRLKSIVMTSLTTILAVCPFLARGSMGDDLQYPMSLVIIIGMTVGTLVSLFVVPTFYKAIYSRRDR